jgi:predicted Ser/Thr protein kinase
VTPGAVIAKFGKYEIIRKLGRSMTDVYLANDPQMGRMVVLKVVERSNDSYTQLVLEAERRGAQIQQQLHSIDPRILEVYEYGEEQDCFFVAMQYAEGRSLAELLQQERRLDPERAARYLREVCSQLTTLHSFQVEIDGRKRSVVHADIKPSNIQIGPNEEVWLLDFGIAKTTSASRSLTQLSLGSPAYCSPERLKSGQVDPHADLWAAGVCLYELIASLPPYQAQSTRRLDNLIQSRRPPRALPDSCPAALKAVIWRALASEPERRYQTAADMEADLAAFLADTPTIAEKMGAASWNANVTINKSRAEGTKARARVVNDFLPVEKAAAEGNRSAVLWSLVTGFIVGLILFVPIRHLFNVLENGSPLREVRDYSDRSIADITRNWHLFQELREQNRFLGSLSPVNGMSGPFRASLMNTADRVINGYRLSSDPDLTHFDWEKGRASLTYALELDPSDAAAKSKLAVIEGYQQLTRNPGSKESGRAALESFRKALTLSPESPDPHLGMARVQIYNLRNMGAAVAEFNAAEKAGFRPGPREIEQRADGYLWRAEHELTRHSLQPLNASTEKSLAPIERDMERARGLFEPITGFSKVDASLARLERDAAVVTQIRAKIKVAKERQRIHRMYGRYRRR